MKTICTILIFLGSIQSFAQTQTKSQCMTTVRVRSMSISSADAEKLCSEDSNEVVNCAVTKLQGPHSGGINESVKACRSEWGLAAPTPPTPPTHQTDPQTPSSPSIKVPTDLPRTEDHDKPKGNFEDI